MSHFSGCGLLMSIVAIVLFTSLQPQRIVLLPYVYSIGLEKTEELKTQIRKDLREGISSSFSVPLFRAVPSPNPA